MDYIYTLRIIDFTENTHKHQRILNLLSIKHFKMFENP